MHFWNYAQNSKPHSRLVLPRHRLRKSYPLPRDVNDVDIRTLLNYIDCPRDGAMFILMLDCGLRVGEVHSLSLDEVHLGNPSQILVHGKGGKRRIVYFSQRAQNALQQWLNSRPVNSDRAVFISEHGKRLSISGIQYLLRGYCEKTGINLTAHQLRHTFGRRMAEAKLPLTSAQSQETLHSIICNADMRIGEVRQFCRLQDEGAALSVSKCQSLMRAAMTQLNLSARAYHRILKLARTVADLAGSEDIQSVHLAEALHASQPPEVDDGMINGR